MEGDRAIVTVEGDDDKLVQECFNKISFIQKSCEIKYGADNKVRQMAGDFIHKYGLVYLIK